MKKNCFLQIFAVMLLSISITGCSSDEFEGEGLYGRWRLLVFPFLGIVDGDDDFMLAGEGGFLHLVPHLSVSDYGDFHD